MLLSAVAGEWVRAARAGGDPPVIAASSANNQAITNIIDAFKENFAEGRSPFAGRWLPGIKSFGLYLPAFRRENEAKRKYQTESFFTCRETVQYHLDARKEYLSHAQAALPELEVVDVQPAVRALRARIDGEACKLEAADAARATLLVARADVARLLGNSPEDTLETLEADRDRCARQDAAARSLLEGWKAYLA